MKKIIALTALCLITTAPVVMADTLGFELGAYQWKPDYSGVIASDSSNSEANRIDIENDLGYSDESHNIIWFSLEHPLPVIPNFKLVSSDLSSSANNTLERSFVFDGETYSVSENVSSTLDLSNTEVTFYYEILDNWVNLDLGITARIYDGEARLTTDTDNAVEEIDFTIPLLYGKARFDLPFSGFFVDAEINIISYSGDSISDVALAAGYESDFGFGAKLGVRKFSLDAEDDELLADVELDGTYLSLFYHF